MSNAIERHKDALWGKAGSLEEIKKMLMPGWIVVVIKIEESFYCYHSALFLANGRERNNKSTLRRRMDDARTIFGFNTEITTIEGE